MPEVNQGSSYEFKNIVPNDGYSFDGVYSGQLKGTVSGDTSVVLSFSKHDLSSITETPEKVAYNGHTYMLYSTPVTWYFAKDFCHTKGGHLVEIDNLEENAFVASLCAEKERVWLGATDLDEDIDTSWLVGPGDPWYWETGRSFKLATSDIPWDTGQPDNYQEPGCDYENYAELFSATGKWTRFLTESPGICAAWASGKGASSPS